MPEAIAAVCPDTVVQACIVHLARHAWDFVSRKSRKAGVPEPRAIHRAQDGAAGLAAIEALEAGPWGARHQAVAPAWPRNRDRAIPFLAVPEATGRTVHTTNAVEALTSGLRRATRARRRLPPDKAAAKPPCPVPGRAAGDRTPPPRTRLKAHAPLAVTLGQRLQIS